MKSTEEQRGLKNPLDVLDSWRWSKEEVKHYAYEQNCPILSSAIRNYEAGNCTWEVAVQVAAVAMAKQHQELFPNI